jgi:hypothetical protein
MKLWKTEGEKSRDKILLKKGNEKNRILFEEFLNILFGHKEQCDQIQITMKDKKKSFVFLSRKGVENNKSQLALYISKANEVSPYCSPLAPAYRKIR